MMRNNIHIVELEHVWSFEGT